MVVQPSWSIGPRFISTKYKHLGSGHCILTALVLLNMDFQCAENLLANKYSHYVQKVLYLHPGVLKSLLSGQTVLGIHHQQPSLQLHDNLPSALTIKVAISFAEMMGLAESDVTASSVILSCCWESWWTRGILRCGSQHTAVDEATYSCQRRHSIEKCSSIYTGMFAA